MKTTLLRSLPVLALLLLGPTAPVLAQKHYSEIEVPPMEDFAVPEAHRVVLDNGLTVFLIEDHELPLVEMSARVGVGSVYEPPEKAGLASITGTVIRTGGTASVPADALNERLESIGAVIETWIGETSGGAFLSSLTETLDEVLPLYVDVLRNPAFPQDKIDLAKTQQRTAVSRRNDDPQSIAFREFDKLLYGTDSPYARYPEYATIDRVERDDLVAFHDRFFDPGNIILGVWGDFDTDEMVARLKSAFGDWPGKASAEPPPLPPVDTGAEYGLYYAPKMDVTQSTILMGHPGEIRMDHPDYFPVVVMNQVLSGFTGRLFQNVRDDQGLAYAVFGGYSANYDRPGRFYAGIMTKSDQTVAGARAVLHEIEKLHDEAPMQEEIELAKDSYLNSFVFNFDTRREVVERMTTYEYYDYPLDFLNRIQEGVEAVDAEGVHRVARRYLKPDRVKILAVGNHEDFGESLSGLGTVDTLDIAIPAGEEPVPEATEEALSAGRGLLSEAVAALGGAQAFEAVKTVRRVSTTRVTTPDGGQMTVSSEANVAYPDRMRIVQKLPMGEITLVADGGEIAMQTPQGTMPAPPPVRQQIEAQRWRDLVFFFANTGDVEVQHLGQEEVAGRTVEVLSVQPPGGVSPFRLMLDAETKVPVAMAYQAPHPMTGAPARTREVFEDYRTVDDLRLPFRSVSYQDEQQAGETSVDALQLNVDLDEGLFSLQ